MCHAVTNNTASIKYVLNSFSWLSSKSYFNSELFFSWALEMIGSEINGCWWASKTIKKKKDFEGLSLYKKSSYKGRRRWWISSRLMDCFHHHFSRNVPYACFSSDNRQTPSRRSSLRLRRIHRVWRKPSQCPWEALTNGGLLGVLSIWLDLETSNTSPHSPHPLHTPVR